MTDVAALRLRAHRLTGPPAASPEDVVRTMGAVQSQDYPAAKWALGMRTGAREADVDRLYDAGAILRTHVMRPTWHFVDPGDVRRLVDLTGPRLRAAVAGRLRQLEIDERQVTRALGVFARELEGGRHRTRRDLGAALARAGVPPDGQRLPHLLGCAEMEGLIVSGAREGVQHTYALLEERAPGAPRMEDRDETVAWLALTYFRSHGPARLADFAWWSGLSVADGRRGVAAAGPALRRLDVDGAEHWADAAAGPQAPIRPRAHLLPNFDEYTVAYRHRAAVHHPEMPVDASELSFGSVLANVVLVDGRVRGGWRRAGSSRRPSLEIRPLSPLDGRERAEVHGAAELLAAFLERGPSIEWAG